MKKIGRPPSCTCGECAKCKRAAYMRDWWARKSPDEKRAAIARRDAERVRRVDRERSRGNPARNRGRKRDLEKLREYRRRYHEHSREKRIARKRVHNAILAGHLVRLPCEICGVEGAHAHHEDYDKPLEVRWLCSAHHGVEHRMTF